jgi:predicted dehydrogenase
MHRTTPMLNVALAGAGMISHHHLPAWKKLSERVQIVAISDPDIARARQRAAEFGIAQVFTDAEALFAAGGFQALDVASPRETHADWVRLAAKHGVDVLCQKPLTPTFDEAAALIAEVSGRIRLMVHENWRFRPWYRELREWIASGDLGALHSVSFALLSSGLLMDENGHAPALVRQPFMADEERLMIMEVLIHHLDTTRFLFGPLRVIAARTAKTLPYVAGETFATILLETPSGVPVTLTGTMAAPGFPPRTQDRLEVIGSRASAVLEGPVLRLLGPEQRQRAFDHDEGYQGSFDSTIAHFVYCLETGAPFETDASENLQTLELVRDAYRAADAALAGR